MAKRTRKIGAIDGKGRGCVVSREVPELAKGTVLVEVHASLISPGTELKGAKQARAKPESSAAEPRPFGYQNAGVVLETGEGVADFKPGDHVACMGGGYALHTDYAVVPKNLCALLPENVSFQEGAYAHLAATSLNAIRRGGAELGENLLVVGLGLVGQLAARLGQLAGAFTMGWDMVPFRVETARRWGIDAAAVIGQEDESEKSDAFTRGSGFDMAVVAIGGEGTDALERVINVMKVSPDNHVMGRVCLVGGATTQCSWGARFGNLDLRSCARTGPGYHDKAWEIGEREYPPTFLRWHTRSNLELVLRLISEGRLDVRALTTHTVPVERIDEVVTAHIEAPDTALGTVLLYDHG